MASIPSQAEASAPGNMMLIGEYAVLEGARAAMMTLKHRLCVALAASDSLKISSDLFRSDGNAKPQHVVLIENILKSFPSAAFDIRISSDIPPTYGFGSSAALVAAVVKALFRFYGREENFTAMFETGHRAILDTFHRGSGADLAAALADMPFLVFDPTRKTATPFALPFGIEAIYTGYKTPTPEVLKKIREEVPEGRWRDLTQKMAACAEKFIANPSAEAVREYQSYMDALGVTCDACRRALGAFEAKGVPAKISGSGRGDCVVGFVKTTAALEVAAPLEYLRQEALAA